MAVSQGNLVLSSFFELAQFALNGRENGKSAEKNWKIQK